MALLISSSYSSSCEHWERTGNLFFCPSPLPFGGSTVESYSRTSGESNRHRKCQHHKSDALPTSPRGRLRKELVTIDMLHNLTSNKSKDLVLKFALVDGSKIPPRHWEDAVSTQLLQLAQVASPALKLSELNRSAGLQQIVDLHIHQGTPRASLAGKIKAPPIAVGSWEVGSNGPSVKTIPVELMSRENRTGSAVETWSNRCCKVDRKWHSS